MKRKNQRLTIAGSVLFLQLSYFPTFCQYFIILSTWMPTEREEEEQKINVSFYTARIDVPYPQDEIMCAYA